MTMRRKERDAIDAQPNSRHQESSKEYQLPANLVVWPCLYCCSWSRKKSTAYIDACIKSVSSCVPCCTCILLQERRPWPPCAEQIMIHRHMKIIMHNIQVNTDPSPNRGLGLGSVFTCIFYLQGLHRKRKKIVPPDDTTCIHAYIHVHYILWLRRLRPITTIPTQRWRLMWRKQLFWPS